MTGRPPDYAKPLVSTPAGAVPTNLYGSVLRGFDVLLVAVTPVLFAPTAGGRRGLGRVQPGGPVLPHEPGVTGGVTAARSPVHSLIVASNARRRGDGRLTHELDPQDRGPQDACGVFGVWAPGEDVAKLTYFGLYALQHRGQESAGIAVSNGRQILVYKDMGLVSQVFDESTLEALKGHLAVGHSRYSTTGRQHLAQRPADLPAHGRRLDRAGPQRQPDQHPRAAGRWSPTCPATPSSTSSARKLETSTNDTSLVTALLAAPPRHLAGGAGRRAAAQAPGRLLVRLDGRDHAVRRPRPAGHPAAGARPPRARLGGGQRDRGPRHRRRLLHPRDRARRDGRGRRARPAHAAASPRPRPRAACSSSSTSPAPTPASPASGSTASASRSAAGWPRTSRPTPTWSSRSPSPAPPPRSGTPRPAASPTASAW